VPARRWVADGDHRYAALFMSMRLTYAAAAVGIAIAVPFIAPVALMGPFAHADTGGTNGYLRCIKSDAPPPPPGTDAQPYRGVVSFIETNLDSGVPPATVVAKLVDMGLTPNDAAMQVRCVMANSPPAHA
jgi:hypothetical protein